MADLLIGSRRPRQTHPLRSAAIAGVLALVAGLVAYLIFQRVTRYELPDGRVTRAALEADGPLLRFGDASVQRVGALRVLRARGGAHDVGVAHGRLLAAEAATVGRALDGAVARAMGRGSWVTRRFGGARLRWAYRLLDDGVPGHYLVEIAGVMRGQRATTGDGQAGFARLVRRHAALDVGVADPAAPRRPTRALARSLTFVAAARDATGDRLLVGRSFGLPGIDDGGDAARGAVAVSFIHAEGALPFASVGWPGAIGVVSGINAEGIAIMVHPAIADDVAVIRVGEPVTLIAREVLEHARTLDDAVAILEHAEPLGAAAFVVIDGNARTWAVVERSPSRTHVDRSPSASVVGDTLAGEPFAADPANDLARRVRPSTARAKRAGELLRARPPVDAAGVVAILRDRSGAGGAPLPLGHGAAIDDLDAVHTAVFDPSAMVLWVADGPAGARFTAFDLRYELRGEGTRAAPPPDIAADAEADPGVWVNVWAARGYLRAAARAGASRRGWEYVQRAIALAPELPSAHRVAGDLARARGEDEVAEAHYRKYLELGPDDSAAEQVIRAIVGRH